MTSIGMSGSPVWLPRWTRTPLVAALALLWISIPLHYASHLHPAGELGKDDCPFCLQIRGCSAGEPVATVTVLVPADPAPLAPSEDQRPLLTERHSHPSCRSPPLA
jgi:hypothetical protein